MKFVREYVVNSRSGDEVVHTLWAAHGFLSRLRGLIGTPPLAPGCALWIQPCNQIHTHFLSYPIDAVFLSADWTVLAVRHSVVPWRILAPVKGARSVLEFCGLRGGSIQSGDMLRRIPHTSVALRAEHGG